MILYRRLYQVNNISQEARLKRTMIFLFCYQKGDINKNRYTHLSFHDSRAFWHVTPDGLWMDHLIFVKRCNVILFLVVWHEKHYFLACSVLLYDFFSSTLWIYIFWKVEYNLVMGYTFVKEWVHFFFYFHPLLHKDPMNGLSCLRVLAILFNIVDCSCALTLED